MGVQWIAGENYVDFFFFEPFAIYACVNNAITTQTSLQTFPVCSRPVDSSADQYRATLWALNSGHTFDVIVGPVIDDIHAGDQSATTTNSNLDEQCVITSSSLSLRSFEKRTLTVKTRPYGGYLCPFAPFSIIDTQIIFRDDFLDCMLAQAKNVMYIELVKESQTNLLHRLYYNSLFAIPWHPANGSVYVLYNINEDRICIDFQQKNIFWRQNRKLRRVISSNFFVVFVNRDIRDSLRLAAEYHTIRVGATWLYNDYINLIIEMANHPQFGVQIMAVEVAEKSTGEICAGCLGYSLGSVYHDFTMFTLRRSHESFGTIATKLLGEALQMCGYDMWYWGLRLDYMDQFHKKYGARNFSRAEFCARWWEFREKQPTCSLEEFFRSGRGMLPCSSPFLI